MKTFKCTCCNSDVTAPYFFKGGVYGYSCIKKVNPSAKRNDDGLWLKADVVNVVQIDTNNTRVKITAKVGGISFSELSFNSEYSRNIKVNSNAIRVSKFKNGSDCLWSQSSIETKRNNKGKLEPISFSHKDNILITL